jgi:hypothetical protein
MSFVQGVPATPSPSSANPTTTHQEQSYALLLGIIVDPEKNQVINATTTNNQTLDVLKIFMQAHRQQGLLKPLGNDAWIQLLPWHSLN